MARPSNETNFKNEAPFGLYKSGLYKSKWTTSYTYTITEDPKDCFEILELAFSKTDSDTLYGLCDFSEADLDKKHILKLVEAMKAKIMIKLNTSDTVSHFECRMTPTVRKNIISAWKKLKMFGKKPPFVPRCDEYMNLLPEKFNVDEGIIVKMVSEDDYGKYYFELQAKGIGMRISSNDTQLDFSDVFDIFIDDLPF